MLRRIDQKLTTWFFRPLLRLYLNSDRDFTYGKLNLRIRKGVFHPRFFFSSLFFADVVSSFELKGKNVCDMGAGSGLLGFVALQQGASVCFADLNTDAVAGLKENLHGNFAETDKAQIFQSDVFSSVPKQQFDFVFVNPPYFFKDAGNNTELAWYCGVEGKFFQDFFSHLQHFTHKDSQVYMSLADNCDLERIAGIASKYGLELREFSRKRIRWEMNYIFRVHMKV